MSTPVNVRSTIVDWAMWAVKHKGQPNFNYSEGADRMEGVNKPGVLPWTGDCSAFVTCLYAWSGCQDPSGQHWAEWDNTTSIAAHGKEVAAPQPGDIVIYSPDAALPFAHAALVVVAGADPMTVSMGENGDPSLVHVSQDGRPHKFYTFDTTAVEKVHTPPVL